MGERAFVTRGEDAPAPLARARGTGPQRPAEARR